MGESAKGALLRRLAILLAIYFGVISLLFFLFIFPDLLSKEKTSRFDFHLKKITILGAQGWDEKPLEELLKPYLGRNIFLVNTYYLEDFIKRKVPWVKRISLEKDYPDHILVRIVPYKPCAILANSGDFRKKLNPEKTFLLVNCEGKVIGRWKESLGIFPILINIDKNLSDLLLFLKEAREEGIYDLISDIELEGEEGDTVLLTIKGGVKFKFSRYDSPRLVAKKIKSVLYVASKKGEKISFVDLTGENARVRLKE